ncbi:hypothetical protein [Rhodocytophaga rosea]|uniref:hypothetical protein n=1 Tax=Rhodocytophaga rosea TaxID=2704465 RepID=UPI001E32E445|nr:hypothetical protein [Rhodocytophaga rosea]
MKMKCPDLSPIVLLAVFIACCFIANGQNVPDAIHAGNMIFPKGEKIQSANFTGSACYT